MDVLFNRQKCLSLQDALYMAEKDFQVDFKIECAKHLWAADKKFKVTRRIENKIGKRFLKKKTCRTSFVWNYDNKMKVFEIADHTTELFYRLYDESFVIQKKLNEKIKDGTLGFKSFGISGGLKYLNCKASPIASKKMVRYFRALVNGDHCFLHKFRGIDENSEWSEDGREYAAGLKLNPCDKNLWNHNVEYFDRLYVGNHKINYFMHTLFVDAFIFTLHDILYMAPKDWSAQFKIHLC